MKAREARAQLEAINKNYLCPICLLPIMFCVQHTQEERNDQLSRLRCIARNRKPYYKPNEKVK